MGSGKLTPQMYFANLRKNIVEDKKIAAELVRVRPACCCYWLCDDVMM